MSQWYRYMTCTFDLYISMPLKSVRHILNSKLCFTSQNISFNKVNNIGPKYECHVKWETICNMVYINFNFLDRNKCNRFNHCLIFHPVKNTWQYILYNSYEAPVTGWSLLVVFNMIQYLYASMLFTGSKGELTEAVEKLTDDIRNYTDDVAKAVGLIIRPLLFLWGLYVS